jgi:hypothetical protein
VHFNQRDSSCAALCYKQFVAENPLDGQQWANHGISLSSLKRYDEAIKAFEK